MIKIPKNIKTLINRGLYKWVDSYFINIHKVKVSSVELFVSKNKTGITRLIFENYDNARPEDVFSTKKEAYVYAIKKVSSEIEKIEEHIRNYNKGISRVFSVEDVIRDRRFLEMSLEYKKSVVQRLERKVSKCTKKK